MHRVVLSNFIVSWGFIMNVVNKIIGLFKAKNGNEVDESQRGNNLIEQLDFDLSSRYLVVKTAKGKIELQPLHGKSLIDAAAARQLKRDMSQTCKRVNEMNHRLHALSGDIDIADLERPIE